MAGLAHIIARDDAPIVRHLLDAGAMIVGRTNTPEFSMRATTNNALYGLTLNPWDARISCGGSSGGAAAAVASGICAIGHGNKRLDTWSSRSTCRTSSTPARWPCVS